MNILFFDWDNGNLNHIGKHHVDSEEVEEAFAEIYYLFRTRDGRHSLLGRSGVGRYLFIVFEYKGQGTARVVTARDMTLSEKRLYSRKVGR